MDNYLGASILGVWNFADMPPCNLPQRAASAFSGAFDGFVGATYEPVLYCGKQVVNGINYAIICKMSVPASGSPVERLVLVIINESSKDGKPSSDKKYQVTFQTILG